MNKLVKNGPNLFCSFSFFLIFIFIFSFVSSLQAQETSQESSLTILFPVEEETQIVPDLYLLRVTGEVRASSEKQALSVLFYLDSELRKLLKSLKGISYKGGNFQIQRNCFWEKNSWTCRGIRGSIFYVFFSNSTSFQSKVVSVFVKTKKRFPFFFFRISYSNWTVSFKKIKTTYQNLRLKAIREILSFCKLLSEETGKKCVVKKIDFSLRSPSEYPVYRSANLKVSLPEPIKDLKEIKISARVEVSCF